MAEGFCVTLQDVKDARERIRGHAHVTPIFTCAQIDVLAGRSVFLKAESFQKVRRAVAAFAFAYPAREASVSCQQKISVIFLLDL